jgi:RecA-family ATPase
MRNDSEIVDAFGRPIRLRTMSTDKVKTWSATGLMEHSRKNPPEPMIRGLLNKGDILLLHGSEESFKSVFVLQIAESIATGRSLLHWRVERSRTVGVIETEMHEAMMGDRLSRMFPTGNPPEKLYFMGESALRDWRRLNLRQKCEGVQKWVNEHAIEVLIIDTANDFFRGADNPSEERAVGQFFDELRSLNDGARIVVRHDRKRKPDQEEEWNSNERIRGSAEWKEDPEVIVSLERRDRRTNEVELEVGKLRYGRKDQPLILWFDAQSFRLTPLPPVIEVLTSGRHSREELIAECKGRFDLGERRVADMLAQNEMFLQESQRGHSKLFNLRDDALAKAPWFRFLNERTKMLNISER